MPVTDADAGRMPAVSVVICALPRSGSWLLAEGLWQTGVAGRPEEYFRPDWLQRFLQTGRLEFQHRLHQQDTWTEQRPLMKSERALRAPDAGQFLREIMSIGTTPNGVFALKCHWFQLTDLTARLARLEKHTDAGSTEFPDAVALHELLPGVRYIRLIREDKLRQAISWYRAITTDSWWASEDTSPADQRRPGYDQGQITVLHDWLQSQEASWDGYFERWGLFPLVVTYRELATAYERTITRVLGHLGLVSRETVIPAARLRKQADALSESWARRHAAGIQAPAGLARVSSRPDGRPDRAGEATMRTSVVLVDNFYANPGAVREYAIKQRYYHPYQSAADDEDGRDTMWMASRFKAAAQCPFKSSLELISRLEYLTGDCIDLDHWNQDFPVDNNGRPVSGDCPQLASCLWNCSFHLKPGNGDEFSEGVHNHVLDSWNSVGEDGWSGLIYLSDDPPLRGGLHMWRNVDPARDYDWMTPKDQWELVDDLGNMPNRLILFRGSVPHSGAPGWGTSLLDGRLFQTFFFRVRPRQPSGGVLAPV